MFVRQPAGLLLGLSLVSFLAASPALAAPGEHIQSGGLTITPSVQLGMFYRSNAFRRQTDPQATGFGALTPAITASADGPDVQFNLGARYTLQKYLFLSNVADPAVRRERISNLDRFNNVGINANLVILPKSVVGFTTRYRLALRNNPSDINIDADDPYTTQFQNAVGAGLDIRPGPALTVTPGFDYVWTQYFVPTNDAVRDPFNVRNAYGPRLDATWRFLPRTNFVFRSQYRFNRWSDNTPNIQGAQIAINDSNLGRVEAGIQGRLTERLRVVFRLGSGFGKFIDSTSLRPGQGLLAVLQGSYDVTEAHNVSLGVRKSFFDSFFTNVVSLVAINASWRGQYGDKVSSDLQIGTRFETYDGPVTRNDQVTRLNLGVDYNINAWAQAGIRGGWLQRRSPSAPAVEYDDINAGLAVTFTY